MKHLLLSSLVALCALLPSVSHAQLAIGGFELGEFPCTCSPFRYAVFAPLYLNSPIPAAGAFSIPDTPNMFWYYYSHPGAWDLGFAAVTPGAQFACWMFVGWGCIPIPNMGIITPFTGTSL